MSDLTKQKSELSCESCNVILAMPWRQTSFHTYLDMEESHAGTGTTGKLHTEIAGPFPLASRQV